LVIFIRPGCSQRDIAAFANLRLDEIQRALAIFSTNLNGADPRFADIPLGQQPTN
jgi:hypothetical protein